MWLREMVDEEERAAAAGDEEYLNAEDPSILRFLIASRDEASAQQLRDDLLGMLVAGHETTASVLTWTIYLLCGRPECLAKVQVRPHAPPPPTQSTTLLRSGARPAAGPRCGAPGPRATPLMWPPADPVATCTPGLVGFASVMWSHTFHVHCCTAARPRAKSPAL